MSDLGEGFFRGAAITKLRQNNRDMSHMGSAIAGAVVEQIKQRRTIDELEQDLVDYMCSLDQVKAHNEAEAARSAHLMALLDEAYGAENNPARQIAHPDQDFRIPSGDRKGEVVTKADEVYLNRFAEAFKTKHAKTWGDSFKSWVKFIHPRITF